MEFFVQPRNKYAPFTEKQISGYASNIAWFAYATVPDSDKRKIAGRRILKESLMANLASKDVFNIYQRMRSLGNQEKTLLELEALKFSPLQIVQYLASTENVNKENVPTRERLKTNQRNELEIKKDERILGSVASPVFLITGATCVAIIAAFYGMDYFVNHSVDLAHQNVSEWAETTGEVMNYFGEDTLLKMTHEGKKFGWTAFAFGTLLAAKAALKDFEGFKQESLEKTNIEDKFKGVTPPTLRGLSPHFNENGEDPELTQQLYAIPRNARVLLEHLTQVELMCFLRGNNEERQEILNRHPPTTKAEMRFLIGVDGFSAGAAKRSLWHLGDVLATKIGLDPNPASPIGRLASKALNAVGLHKGEVKKRLERIRTQALGLREVEEGAPFKP